MLTNMITVKVKNSLSCVLVLSTTLVTASCGYKVDLKTPEYKMPDINKLYSTCSKTDAEQPKVDQSVLNRTITLEDEIGNISLENVDCENQVHQMGRTPERNLTQSMVIEAPVNLPEPVLYVSIENAKTCSTYTMDTQDSISGQNMFSSSDRTGNAFVQVSDSTVKFGLYLNVADGLNVLKVKYFGKCIENSATKNSMAADDSYMNCKVGKEIGSQDVVLQVNVNRPDVDGIKRVNNCKK